MALIRSIVYLSGMGGIGYVLMKVVTPDEQTMLKKLPKELVEPRSLAEKKRQAIVDVLRDAAEGRQPMYRQTRQQIDAARENASPNKPTST